MAKGGFLAAGKDTIKMWMGDLDPISLSLSAAYSDQALKEPKSK